VQPLFQRRFHLVQRRVNRRDAVDDPRRLGGVLDPQPVHDLDQHLELAPGFEHRLLDFAALGHPGDLVHRANC
jgi:hypothetical protein